MTRIDQLLAQIAECSVSNEDGEIVKCTLQPGLAAVQLREYEASISAALPNDFGDFLRRANGMSLFGHAIMPISEQVLFQPHGFMSFHNWGNGDFDCIALSDSVYECGSVLFMNHSPDVTVKIAGSFSNWLEAAIGEIQEFGVLLHPSDYRHRAVQGLYRHVLPCLAGVHCELNN